MNEFTRLLLSIEKEKDNESTDEDESDDFTDSQGRSHQGDMKIDATCSDAEVRYPTDIDLLMDGSRVINRYTDSLCARFLLPRPTRFEKQTRTAYLGVIKYKRKTKKMLDRCKYHILTCLSKGTRKSQNPCRIWSQRHSRCWWLHLHRHAQLAGLQRIDGLEAANRTLRATIWVFTH